MIYSIKQLEKKIVFPNEWTYPKYIIAHHYSKYRSQFFIQTETIKLLESQNGTENNSHFQQKTIVVQCKRKCNLEYKDIGHNR